MLMITTTMMAFIQSIRTVILTDPLAFPYLAALLLPTYLRNTRYLVNDSDPFTSFTILNVISAYAAVKTVVGEVLIASVL